MSLCGQKKYVCDPKLIPSPDRPWLYKAREAMSHVHAPISERLNYDNEFMRHVRLVKCIK